MIGLRSDETATERAVNHTCGNQLTAGTHHDLEIVHNTMEVPKISRIRSRFQRELDAVLKKYFHTSTQLSKPYWPKSMRNFLLSVFTSLLSSEKFQLSTRCNVDQLNVIVSELRKGTCHYITASNRKFVWDFLLRIRTEPAFRIITLTTSAVSTGTKMWPGDIASVEDVPEFVAGPALREDVEGFLVAVIAGVVGKDPFKISFDRAATTHPIVVEVPASFVASVIEVLEIASENTVELSPKQLVEVRALLEVDSIVKEEALLTSGSPWRQGTLGAVLSFSIAADNDGSGVDDSAAEPHAQLVGITCAHVHATQGLGYEPSLQGKTIFSAKSQDTDVAFFEIIANATHPAERIYNLFALADIDIPDIRIGEVVYKIGGAATGVTTGFLRAQSMTYVSADGSQYKRCVEVSWEPGVTFASAGDCGALYCVRRGGAYIPIGIHRISGDSSSFGTSFEDAIELLFDGNHVGGFVNAPNSFVSH
jgi:hypothetical protein